MSKFIPNKQKQDHGGQDKPKLKIRVMLNDEEKILNEYDLASMVSDLNVKIAQLSQSVNGIINAMQAATQQVSAPKESKLSLPKLKTVQAGMEDGTKFYNSNGGVKIES